jgi:hypothetical protein
VGAAGQTAAYLELRATYCLAVARAQEAKHADEIKRAGASTTRGHRHPGHLD